MRAHGVLTALVTFMTTLQCSARFDITPSTRSGRRGGAAHVIAILVMPSPLQMLTDPRPERAGCRGLRGVAGIRASRCFGWWYRLCWMCTVYSRACVVTHAPRCWLRRTTWWRACRSSGWWPRGRRTGNDSWTTRQSNGYLTGRGVCFRFAHDGRNARSTPVSGL